MIRGTVNAGLVATISVAVRGPDRDAHSIEAIVDTGFNGFLTLSSDVVSNFNLPLLYYGRVILADGTPLLLPTHGATVIWDGKALDIEVLRADSKPLIGMSLMKGYRLDVEVANRGKVIMRRLAPTRKRKKTKRR